MVDLLPKVLLILLGVNAFATLEIDKEILILGEKFLKNLTAVLLFISVKGDIIISSLSSLMVVTISSGFLFIGDINNGDISIVDASFVNAAVGAVTKRADELCGFDKCIAVRGVGQDEIELLHLPRHLMRGRFK